MINFLEAQFHLKIIYINDIRLKTIKIFGFYMKLEETWKL